MKIFVLKDRDKSITKDPLLWLFYSSNSGQFHIELPDGADPLNVPMPLDAYYKRGLRSIDMKESLRWVRMRIVPPDRQNISEILKQVSLKAYDEYSLLVYNKGVCSQDDYYITSISYKELPEYIRERLAHRIVDFIPTEDFRMIVFFMDGSTKLCDVRQKIENTPSFTPLRSMNAFNKGSVQEDGFGVCWGDNEVMYDELYSEGIKLPITMEDLLRYMETRIIDAQEASGILNCTTQNLLALKNRGKISPVKSSGKYNIYLRKDIEKLRKR